MENNYELVFVRIYGFNTTPLPKLVLNVAVSSGKVLNVTADYVGRIDDTCLWEAVLELTEEGEYVITLTDPFTKKILFQEKYPHYDEPEIREVTAEVKGATLLVKVKVRDTTGVEEVTVETFGKNYTAKPFKVDKNGNGIWLAEIPLKEHNTMIIRFRVYAIDKTDKHVTAIREYFELNVRG